MPSRSPNLSAALWLLASILLATVMTGTIRQGSAELPTPMLAFLRTSFGLLMVLPFLARTRTGPTRLRFTLWRHHLMRGLLIVVALNTGFFAIAKLPLATATILFFLAPVFTTVLAGPLLGETVGPRRWAAVAAGFAGALIILRPDTSQLDPAMLSAMVSSAAFSMVLLLGKRAAEVDGSDSVFVSSNVVVGIVAVIPALFFWQWPAGLALWLVIAVLGLTSNLRGYADIRAYAIGEASFLAPLSYLRLITIGVMGFAIFDETPDRATILGGAVIVGSTLYIALREARLSRPRTAANSAPDSPPPPPSTMSENNPKSR